MSFEYLADPATGPQWQGLLPGAPAPFFLRAGEGEHAKLFGDLFTVLVSGDEGEINEVRALQLLADRGGDTVTSRPLATLYGFSSHSRVRPALARLQGRGLVDERDGTWYIVDPLFSEWLRRSSPLADRPILGVSDDD